MQVKELKFVFVRKILRSNEITRNECISPFEVKLRIIEQSVITHRTVRQDGMARETASIFAIL